MLNFETSVKHNLEEPTPFWRQSKSVNNLLIRQLGVRRLEAALLNVIYQIVCASRVQVAHMISAPGVHGGISEHLADDAGFQQVDEEVARRLPNGGQLQKVGGVDHAAYIQQRERKFSGI